VAATGLPHSLLASTLAPKDRPRPLLLSKEGRVVDEHGAPLLSGLGELRPSRIMAVVAEWLARLNPALDRRHLVVDFTAPCVLSNAADATKRLPYFCSGCPHGRSTKLPDGSRFMARYDDRLELAPRDVVARAIDAEMKRLGIPHVLLDLTHLGADFVRAHFPTIHARLLELDIDCTQVPIPVVPAAHYSCGGVMVTLDGRTDLAGLWAAGEVTQSGLHGANRLASNSLLECLVFGQAVADDIAAQTAPNSPRVKPWDESRVTDSDEEVVIAHNWDELRRTMWDYVGIVRTDKRLERAAHRVKNLRKEVQDYYGNFRITADLIELRNLVTVADLIVRSARRRRESRGLHYSTDYPAMAAKAVDTILDPVMTREA
jgi:L-aspartate oxidase